MRDAGHQTPDAGHRTSDGEKSKNNISTPQGGGHNSKIDLIKLQETQRTCILEQNLTMGTYRSCAPVPVSSRNVGAQLRSQPILRWAIAQLRILSWVAYLKMG